MSSKRSRGRKRGGREPARERSAGGVVVRGEQVVVIVPTRRASDGSRVLALPKGHIDPGENALQAATREVREETGIVGEPITELGETRYWYRRDGQTIPKSVCFFLFSYVEGSTDDHDDEVEEARWIGHFALDPSKPPFPGSLALAGAVIPPPPVLTPEEEAARQSLRARRRVAHAAMVKQELEMGQPPTPLPWCAAGRCAAERGGR